MTVVIHRLVGHIVSPFKERLAVVGEIPQERVGDVRWQVWTHMLRLNRLVEEHIND